MSPYMYVSEAYYVNVTLYLYAFICDMCHIYVIAGVLQEVHDKLN